MTVDHREILWAKAVAAIVMAATCLPYVFGLFIAPPGMHYMGLLGNPDDQNVYMAWMRQAADGRFLFLDLFTTEPQRAGFLHVYFLVLGLIAWIARVPLIWVYHAARMLCGWALLVVFYRFCAAFIERVPVRRLAFLLAALSSGLGWLFYFVLPPGSPHPGDFGRGLIMPEAVTFLTLLLNPLFSFSMALMLGTFLLAMRATEAGSVRLAAWAGLLGLLLGNAHTYDMVTVYVVLALYAIVLLARRNLRGVALLALVVAISMPSVLYQVWLFRTNPVFRLKALTPTLSPPFVMLLLTFGIPLLLAIPGAISGLRSSRWRPFRDTPRAPLPVQDPEKRGPSGSLLEGQGRPNGRQFALPVIWVAAGLLLLELAPLSFQRKLAEGLHLPICLLAAVGADRLLEARRWAQALLIALACLSNVFFIYRAGHDLIANNVDYRKNLMPPLYLSRDELGAVHWLRRETEPDSIILSSSVLGSYLPGLSGRRVYVGHWAETINFKQKLGIAFRMVQTGTQEKTREALVRQARITHVLQGPFEKGIGEWDPAASVFTRLEYQNQTVRVFSIRPP